MTNRLNTRNANRRSDFDSNDFAVAVEVAAMIHSVYLGRYDPRVAEVKPIRVVLGLARRLFD